MGSCARRSCDRVAHPQVRQPAGAVAEPIVRVRRTGRSQVRSHRLRLNSGALSASPSSRGGLRNERAGRLVGRSALPSDRPCRCDRLDAVSRRCSDDLTGIGRLCRGRAALGGDSCEGAADGQPSGEGSIARPSNSTLQPTSGAATGLPRSVDGVASGNVLCDGVGALRRAAIRPRSRLNVRR